MNQPYFSEGSEALLALEAMVDKVGLRNVLYALSHICDAKAEHLAVNWQDHETAHIWSKDAKRIDAFAAHRIEVSL